MITNFKKLFLTIFILFLAYFSYSKSAYFYYETRNVPSGLSLMGLSTKPYYGRIDYLFSNNNLSDGFMVYKQIQTPSGPLWAIYFYDLVFGGWNFDLSDTNAFINHGEAVYVYNPGQSFEMIFIGEAVANSQAPLNKGFNLICLKTLKSGGITSAHGLSPNDGDVVYKRIGDSWSIHTFEDGAEPSWQPSEPNITPFEGFFYSTQTSFNWFQNQQLPNTYNSVERRTLGAFQVQDGNQNLGASIYCVGTKLNTESMITFSYSTVLSNQNWYTFSSYGPGLQPNDEIYTGFWTVQPFSRFGFIRISSW